MVIIIIPSCLKVDKAMTFFMSVSQTAPTLAINIVKDDTPINKTLEATQLRRIIKYTPAVTKVEECTKADTGVGAAIAAGSQIEKGICALLVNAAHINNIGARLPPMWKDQEPLLNITPTNNKIITSPKRFINTVTIPELKDPYLW